MPKIFANGIDFFYEKHGEAENPTIVLIGGLTRDHRVWDGIINYLTLNFQVIVYDNRGTGQTDKPRGAYTTEILADDLAALMDAINIKSAHIVGHSMGGFSAQYLAAKHPEKITSLILCSTCIKPSEECRSYFKQRLSLSEAGTTPFEEMIRSALPWLFTANFLTAERIQLILAGAKSNPHPQSKQSLEAQIVACLNHDSTTILSSIKAPTLVITGKEDKMMTPGDSQNLKDKIIGADLVIIDNAAHMLQLEKPEELCKTIERFSLSKEKICKRVRISGNLALNSSPLHKLSIENKLIPTCEARNNVDTEDGKGYVPPVSFR